MTLVWSVVRMAGASFSVRLRGAEVGGASAELPDIPGGPIGDGAGRLMRLGVQRQRRSRDCASLLGRRSGPCQRAPDGRGGNRGRTPPPYATSGRSSVGEYAGDARILSRWNGVVL
ncbi:hypothetical protein FMEAI12_4840002 [Parafrankia sp. Ea1.12]|nr:hypothetical protein FMEAI12_4840002 [Parafrankia sp. Ea1.12]